MTHCLFKLKFSSPVHFGTGDFAHSVESSQMNFAADTLFSALCHTAAMTGEIDRLVSLARNRKLMFTDAFPYSSDEFWLPRPMLTPKTERSGDPSERKKLKKLAYVPAKSYNKYIMSQRGIGAFDPDTAQNDFGRSGVCTKATIGAENASPYSVGIFEFHENCGLWFAVGYESKDDESFIERLVRLLGLGGIGGKVSSGYGKFELAGVIGSENAKGSAAELFDLLTKKGSRFVTLTTAIVRDDELDDVIADARYQLVRRGGYAFTDKSDRLMKKQTGYLFAAGSTFASGFNGEIPDVGIDMPHPIWRYGVPVFIQVDY